MAPRLAVADLSRQPSNARARPARRKMGQNDHARSCDETAAVSRFPWESGDHCLLQTNRGSQKRAAKRQARKNGNALVSPDALDAFLRPC